MSDEGKKTDEIRELAGEGNLNGPPANETKPPAETAHPIETENMEVHHHPDLHHNKKNFREYFLEFLMIFLAVSMGFIAENIREHISDGEKEKQYMESLLVDVRGDTTKCGRAIRSILKQVHQIDTLEEKLASVKSNSDTNRIRDCYNLSECIQSEHSVTFNERTITQLISSGNMRLLRKNASDSIMDYFTEVKDIEDQKQFYTGYVLKCLDQLKDYFQFRYIQTNITSDSTYELKAAKYGNPALLITDSVQIGKFNSTIEFTKRIAFSYANDLDDIRRKAADLLVFLQKEYGIE